MSRLLSDISDDGILTTWSIGGAYCWYGIYSAPQDFRTGELTGPYGSRVYRLTPGVDTRTIFSNPDTFVHLPVNNLIPNIFRPGPGVLDASGTATGRLDLSTVPRIGWPFWIAVVVLDPAALSGIAFIPDVRVIKI